MPNFVPLPSAENPYGQMAQQFAGAAGANARKRKKQGATPDGAGAGPGGLPNGPFALPQQTMGGGGYLGQSSPGGYLGGMGVPGASPAANLGSAFMSFLNGGGGR